jgi:hypothetical protein
VLLLFLKEGITKCLEGYVCEVYSVNDMLRSSKLIELRSDYYILSIIPSKCKVSSSGGEYIDSLCVFKYIVKYLYEINIQLITDEFNPILIIITPYSVPYPYIPKFDDVPECILKIYVNKEYFEDINQIFNVFPTLLASMVGFVVVEPVEVMGFYRKDLLNDLLNNTKQVSSKLKLIDCSECVKRCSEWFMRKCDEEGCSDEDVGFLKKITQPTY